MKRYLITFLIIFTSCENKNSDISTDSALGLPKCLVTSFKYINSQNKVLSNIEYEFDNKYNILKTTQNTPDLGKIITKNINYYDEINNLIKSESFNEKGELVLTTTYLYFKNGLLQKSIEESFNELKTQEFNENGKLIKFVTKIKSQNFNSSEKNIIYNKYNLIEYEEAYFNKSLIYKRLYSYNLKNLLIKSEITENNIKKITEYIYDSKYRVLKTIEPDNTNTEYSYSNELLVEKTATKNGSFLTSSKFQYDTNGNLLKELSTKNGKSYLPILENMYFPNSSKIEKTIGFLFKPNSTETTIKWYETTKDQSGNDLSSIYYDTNSGNLDYKIEKTYLCK